MKKLLFICILFLFSNNLYAKQIPVEDFFKSQDISNLYLSPTGEYLAAVFQDEEKYKIATLDTNTLKLIKVINVSNSQGDDVEISGLQWVNDERFLFRVRRQFGSLAAPFGTGEVMASNFDGTKQMFLPSGFSLAGTMPEDPKHILGIFSNRKGFRTVKRVRLYDRSSESTIASRTKTKSTFTLDSSPFRGGILTDHDGVIRIAVDDDQRGEQKTYYRANKDSEWELIQTRREGSLGYSFVRFSKDNQKIYLFNDKVGEEGYYLYDPKDKSKKLIWKDKGVVTPSLVYDNSYPIREPIGVMRHDGVPTVEYFDLSNPYSKLLSQIQAAFPDEFTFVRGSTKDGKSTLVNVVSDRNPGDFYLLNTETKKLRYLSSSASWIKPKTLAKREPISYKARDGLKIHGYLTRPIGKEKNLPLILLVHGGPYGPRDFWWYDREAALFADNGYAVLQVNYRGSGGYGTKFQYDAYRQMGAEMQDDLTDATLWAVEQGIADKNRLCIYGGSYGGYAALMGAVKEPDLYKCAVGYVGVYDIEIQNKSDIGDWEGGRYFLDVAWNNKDPDFVRERSAVYHVDKIKSALMLVHGKADRRVPYANFTALTSALDDINYPYESVVEDLEGHGFYKEENNVELYTKMLKFFDKHIGK
ncbi:S9 family peptidase [Kangiella sp. HZ709]|uniref:alpha/beta hydrolase family protein n=1 Tax=Kangiella sp. HZ709 TaxID=2666328 RepID=UPI0012AF7ABC|nr:S9 family peptidase [Kangiella sp. HZ709]MRX27724.1 prolyl oligopeptidase family serine peptidase [Kangiella sp. HZ709]